jgi:hypothetical protein
MVEAIATKSLEVEKVGMIEIDWNDPNLQIGGGTPFEAEILAGIETARDSAVIESIKQEIYRGSAYWDIRFDLASGAEHYVVIQGDPNASSPITIHPLHKREHAWILSKSSDKWRFTFSPLFSFTTRSNPPECWSEQDFLREMSIWPPTDGDRKDSQQLAKINGHYAGLMFWLRFRKAKDGVNKDELRKLLYSTKLINWLPYVNLSEAKRNFAYLIYPWSELAQRASGEEHLWFCLEYSGCLQKLYENVPGKETIRSSTTKKIRLYKDALKTGNFDSSNLLTIEKLQEQGEDWRVYIEDLLIQDTIKTCWEDGGNTSYLAKQLRLYLNSLSSFNGAVGHGGNHIVMRRNSDGRVFESRQDGSHRKREQISKRSKGRPPKGSNNVKNC